MAHFGKALDEVRAGETRALKEKGYEPVLSKSRWLLLKRPENLTDKQESRLADLLQYNLKSVRALSAQGGVPVLLELCLALLGRPVPGSVVHQDHAFENRAYEEGGQNAAQAQASAAQSGSGPRASFQRRCGGF